MKSIIYCCYIILLTGVFNNTLAQKNEIKIDSFGFPRPGPGNMAPDFLQHDVDGKPVKLSDFKGKYVLLDFWGSLCAPCRRAHPHLRQVYDQYKAKNFTILSVSVYDMPDNKQRWLTAIATDKLTWTQVSDPRNAGVAGVPNKQGKYNEAAAKYGVVGIPRNFLISPSGEILAIDLKGEVLDKKLAEVLGKN
jgi:peroxiredoxin